MGKMNALSLEVTEQHYDDYLESVNQDFRKEGAEELRKAIVQELTNLRRQVWTRPEKIAYDAAIIAVENAHI